MEDELLQELDSIIKPAIQRALQSAKRQGLSSDPREAFLDNFKIEIDNTKVDISKNLYKLDLAMQGCSTQVEREAFDFELPQNVEEFPEIDTNDYVKETPNGFEVWNGAQWVQLSKEADFKVEVFQNSENDYKSAVRVWAYDKTTETRILFVDNDINAPGHDYAHTQIADFGDDTIPRERYWEDPMYNIAKNVTGIAGLTAGVLELRHVGNITPWRTGNAFRNADGWYRNKEGIYEQLSKQRGRGAGGYQKSAKRAFKKAKIFKSAGKIFFLVGIGFSGHEFANAYITQDSNRNEVYAKAIVDVTIAAIGVYGGPVGWVVAGTYFVLDVSGAFGDWGQPSGISQWQLDQETNRKFRLNNWQRIKSLEFEVDYIAPIEQQHREMYQEERMIKRDNTRVAIPKILFRKD